MPINYHLTYSFTENDSFSDVYNMLISGINVAIVFEGEPPKRWNGFEVIDGSAHDWRFRDPRGVVVGLCAKGKAKHDQTGFVVRGY